MRLLIEHYRGFNRIPPVGFIVDACVAGLDTMTGKCRHIKSSPAEDFDVIAFLSFDKLVRPQHNNIDLLAARGSILPGCYPIS